MMTTNRIPHKRDAKYRREVRLPDGRIGRLKYLRQEGLAVVIVGKRHYRIQASELSVFSTHSTPDESGVLSCCFHLADEILEGDRFTADPEMVSCPGWIYAPYATIQS